MAIPAIPSNFVLQQANRQVYLSWDNMPGAASYIVQQSLDGVAYSTVASPTTNEYLDITVTAGVNYFYQIAATNVDGTSPFTLAQSIVPAPNGEVSLGQLRLTAQQRADRENSQFVTKAEWNSYINSSLFELYDLLITMYGEEYFVAPALSFVTGSNVSSYPLPDGANYNGAPAMYKLLGVDLGINTVSNAYVSVKRFNFLNRNQFLYPNSGSTIYGVNNLRYRQMGNELMFIPSPTSNQPMRLWYIPRMTMLLKDSDLTTSGVSAWWEYVVIDAAIKALMKEESDVQMLALAKVAMIERIKGSAPNRDAGQPDTITDSRSGAGPWGHGDGWGSGPMGGI